MSPCPIRLRPILLAAMLALGGCRLIDQRTFERTPETPNAAALAHPVLPPLPAARLRPADPSADWRTVLDDAVLRATAHNPDARFELLTPVPTSASRDEQDRFAREGAQDAQTVAAALQEDRVDPSRITIGYVGDPGHPVREVRLYIR
jgi:hypothetical protein